MLVFALAGTLRLVPFVSVTVNFTIILVAEWSSFCKFEVDFRYLGVDEYMTMLSTKSAKSRSHCSHCSETKSEREREYMLHRDHDDDMIALPPSLLSPFRPITRRRFIRSATL